MVLSKGAEPPSVRGSVPPGVWRVGEVYSRGSRDRAGATGSMAFGVSAGLVMGMGWGARWRLGSRGQGNGMNCGGLE